MPDQDNIKIGEVRIFIPPPLDESKFCDPDIVKEFEDKDYLTGTMLIAQLIKELKILNSRESKKESGRFDTL